MSHFAQRTQVVINPSARSGRGAQALQKLRAARAALPHAGGLEWVESQSPAHFVELVQKAQDPAASLRALAVAGGDGTVTMAIDALAAKGMLFKHAWSCAPVCAAARTCGLAARTSAR